MHITICLHNWHFDSRNNKYGNGEKFGHLFLIVYYLDNRLLDFKKLRVACDRLCDLNIQFLISRVVQNSLEFVRFFAETV